MSREVCPLDELLINEFSLVEGVEGQELSKLSFFLVMLKAELPIILPGD